MKRITKVLLICLGLVVGVAPGLALFSPLDDIRCCTAPVRDADGSIHRSEAVRAAFKRLYPCPSTLQRSGPCPGWILDHPLPLACGGVDAVYNLQWMPEDMWRAKSKWELKVYGGRGMSPRCP